MTTKNTYGNTRERKDSTTALIYGKLPPQDQEMEKAVLGAMLLNKECVEEVLNIIYTPDIFYKEVHNYIYQAIKNLFNTGAAIDMLTVTDQLRKQEHIELIGGPQYLIEITLNVVSDAHVVNHSRILIEKYMKRETIRLCSQAISNAYDEAQDVFDLINSHESKVVDLLQSSVTNEPKHIAEIASENIIEANERRQKEIDHNGPRIGIKSLEDKLVCWQPGDLVIIAARPSTGKTALALQFALGSAIDQDIPTPVAVFSIEMEDKRITERLQSNLSGVAMDKVKQPKRMNDQEFNNYCSTADYLKSVPIHIDDTSGITLTELRAKVKKLVRKKNVGLVIIDYLQIMGVSPDAKNREQEISTISRGLKQLARECNIPIIALSQLNREMEKRANNTPKLSDIRESGAIEQDADVIILLYRASKEEVAKDASLGNVISADIAKFRNGGVTDEPIILTFKKDIQRITDHEPEMSFPVGGGNWRQIPPEKMPFD